MHPNSSNVKSSGLPTINDSQHSRATGGADHPSQSSNQHLSSGANPISPKTGAARKLIISEDQITRIEETGAPVSSVRNNGQKGKGLPSI